MTDYQRRFPIHGETPASTNLELTLRDTMHELTDALGTTQMTTGHLVTRHIADIFAAVHAVTLELESRINLLEDELRNR